MPVVTIGGATVDAGPFLAAARFLGLFQPVLDHVVRRELVLAQKIAVSEEELQAEADALRRTRGLHTARATNDWLAAIGYGVEELERELELRVALAKKRAAFSEADVERWFAERGSELDRARVSRATFPTAEAARGFVARVREGADFARLAEEQGVPVRAGWARRAELGQADMQAFLAEPGDVLPLQAVAGGVEVIQVHARERATLDAAAREHARDALVERWVEGLRARERVVLGRA